MTPAVTRPSVIQLWLWNQKFDGVQWDHHEDQYEKLTIEASARRPSERRCSFAVDVARSQRIEE
jgi:hypothetical protein